MIIRNNTFNRVAILAILFFTSVSFFTSPFAKADQFDNQISQLKTLNDQNQSNVNQLQSLAISYNDAISKLQQQINSIQAAVLLSQQKSVDVQNQIVAAQAELDKERTVLGESIKTMYLEGQISTLEMLASSKNLSEFMDKQTYRSSVESKIKSTLEKITALKAQLKIQEQQLQDLIKAQQAQQQQVVVAQAQQAQLLAYTEAQKDQYNQQINANKSKIADLQNQQIAENARLAALSRALQYSRSGGSYPWSNAVCLNGDHSDAACSPSNVGESLAYNWGYLPYNQWDENSFQYRNCTSYVAYKIRQATGISVAGYGNAKQWVYNTSYHVDHSPSNNDIEAAVFTSGYYGHVMYVQSVNSDGSVNVSQYNFGGRGEYSTMTINPITTNAYFIHIPR
ncbi:MAG: hypothetical protein NVSMB46_09920 [Candidatus Saccharimonadales bacterium]